MIRDKAKSIVIEAIAEELNMRYGIDYDLNATMVALGANSLDTVSLILKIESMVNQDLNFETADPSKVTVEEIIAFIQRTVDGSPQSPSV